jgi:transposase
VRGVAEVDLSLFPMHQSCDLRELLLESSLHQRLILTAIQQDELRKWVAQKPPRTTGEVGEWIEKSFGVSYTCSALVKLLTRLGFDIASRR